MLGKTSNPVPNVLTDEMRIKGTETSPAFKAALAASFHIYCAAYLGDCTDLNLLSLLLGITSFHLLFGKASNQATALTCNHNTYLPVSIEHVILLQTLPWNHVYCSAAPYKITLHSPSLCKTRID